jgi:hypothetical protein
MMVDLLMPPSAAWKAGRKPSWSSAIDSGMTFSSRSRLGGVAKMSRKLLVLLMAQILAIMTV